MADIARTTLFQIEKQLAELIEYRDTEELTQEERAVADSLIAEYVKRELVKVDSIRGYLRHCEMMESAAKAESKRLTDLAGMWENRAARLKDICKDLMSSLGKKRLEGTTGVLLLKGNGGKQAVEVYDERLIPDDLCEYEGRISGAAWEALEKLVCEALDFHGMKDTGRTAWDHWRGRQDVNMQRVPHKGRIGAALESGHVPGARLKPRGESVIVK